MARLDFPLLHTKEEFKKGTPTDAIRSAQAIICWAELLLIAYPFGLAHSRYIKSSPGANAMAGECQGISAMFIDVQSRCYKDAFSSNRIIKQCRRQAEN